MSRALELFSVVTCCFHVVVPARLPQMSDWTRLSPLHSRTHSCHCVTFVDVALLFISRCLPALLVLAFYETFQNIAFILLLLSLSLSFVTTFLMFCLSLFACVGEYFHFASSIVLFRVVMVVLLSVFCFCSCSVYWCDPGGLFCMVSERIWLTSSVVFVLFPSKIVCIFCVFFVSVSKNSNCNA